MLSAASSRRARSLPPSTYGSSSLAGILSSGGGNSGVRSTRFGPLRSALSRPGKESTSMGRGRKTQRYPSGGSRRSNGLHKMDSVGKKRIPDYTDIAYREAVSRLRYLLADSYTSPHRASFRGLSYTSGARTAGEESGGEDTDAVIERTRALLSPYRRPLYTPARRSLYGTTSRSPIRPMAPSVQVDTPQESHTAPATPRAGTTTHGTENSGQLPPEMMAYIERQEEYIDQLERESHFCREELTSLLGKVKEVISENEGLQEKQKTGVLKSVFDYLHSDNEEGEEEDEDTETSEIEPRKKKRERRQRLEGPNIVFESRISELEAQLTQVRIDLKKAQDEADVYKRRLAGEGLLSDISGVEPESLRHQMEALKREKDELAETVSKLQHTVAQLREREADTTHRLKRSQEAVEQAQFEKSQGELEIRRLKDELDRLHGKLREAVAEQGRRAAEERAGVERRFQQQIEQLQADLTAQWDSTGRLQLDIEKQRRIEAELRREIANKNATLDEMAKETQAKIDMLQGKLSDAVSQHTSLGQELATAEAQADRAEREGRQESKRLGAEVAALRERLDRADSETLRARQEALRLSEQLAALDREMTLRKTKEEIPPTLREQELTSMIKNMEEKHVDTVAELEGMIQSQNQVMAKLKDECHILTERLEDTSARHKAEMAGLQNNIDYLTSKFEAQEQREMESSAYGQDAGGELGMGVRDYSDPSESVLTSRPYESPQQPSTYLQSAEPRDDTYTSERRSYDPSESTELYTSSAERGGNYEASQRIGKFESSEGKDAYQSERMDSTAMEEVGQSVANRSRNYDSGPTYQQPQQIDSRDKFELSPSRNVSSYESERMETSPASTLRTLDDTKQRSYEPSGGGYQQPTSKPEPRPNYGPSEYQQPSREYESSERPTAVYDSSPAERAYDRAAIQGSPSRTATYQTPVQETPRTTSYQSPIQEAPSRTSSYQPPIQESPSRAATYQSPVQEAPRTTNYQSSIQESPNRAPTYQSPIQESPSRVPSYQPPIQGSPSRTTSYQPPIQESPSRMSNYQPPIQESPSRTSGNYQPATQEPTIRTSSYQPPIQESPNRTYQQESNYQPPMHESPSRPTSYQQPIQESPSRAYQSSTQESSYQPQIQESSGRQSSYQPPIQETPNRAPSYQPPIQESSSRTYQAPTQDSPSRTTSYQPTAQEPPTRTPTAPASYVQQSPKRGGYDATSERPTAERARPPSAGSGSSRGSVNSSARAGPRSSQQRGDEATARKQP